MAHAHLLTPAQMSEADKLTAEAGVGTFALMQRAGEAVAEEALLMHGAGDVLIVAGPGNNGGDGFLAAAVLARAGCRVRVALLGPRERITGDAARAFSAYEGAVAPLDEATDLSADLVVDALFGAGLQRPLEGEAARAIEALNAAGRPVLSIDLPSGIDGRTGEVRGTAIRAKRTVTFFRLKPGHLLMPGRSHCGQVELKQIGIADAVLDTLRPSIFHNGPSLWREHVRAPRLEDHKYARGHVVVVSGSATSTGAARLAAAGAARIGAGAVTVASPPDAFLVNAAHLTAVMVRAFDGAGRLAELVSDRRVRAVAIGPGAGVGVHTRSNVEALLASPIALVLDADALTCSAADRETLFRAIAGRAAPVFLTPHEGEFVRLFPGEGAKIDRAARAAKASRAVVVLKGVDTIIASPDGRMAINANAPPDLATAGSGDVLAGMIAGLAAQGCPAFEAAAAAVWVHGAAGAAIGRGLIAEDIPDAIPAILKQISEPLGSPD